MQQQPLKVFQNCPHFFKAGGIETLLKNWYKQANPQQISMDFGTNASPNMDSDFVAYVRKRENVFLIGKGVYLPSKKLPHLANLYKLFKKNKYDVFQSHIGAFPFLFLESWTARLAGIKKRYLLAHSPLENVKIPFYKQFIRWNLLHSHTHFIAVSEHSGKGFYGKNIPFAIVHPGIDTSAFAYNPNIRRQMRAQLGLESNFVIGHVGRLSPEKNHSFLLDIFHEIYKQNPTSRLVLVGSGPEKKNIHQKASQLNLEKQILFTGTVESKEKVELYYQAFDTFVLPSIYEGLPLAALEAQTAGLPCFLSDTIAPQVQVCNTTFLSLQQSPAIWAKEILTKQENFIRENGSERVKQAGFDMSCFFNKMEQLYRER